ncbi:probable UbiA prenyltransferase domain-containing protein 1 [Coccomyxa sp. Obi]|nr:probable UbiA prenyltransferase domain-containing protein 1 [Coccomyxa sp. Obi]
MGKVGVARGAPTHGPIVLRKSRVTASIGRLKVSGRKNGACMTRSSIPRSEPGQDQPNLYGEVGLLELQQRQAAAVHLPAAIASTSAPTSASSGGSPGHTDSASSRERQRRLWFAAAKPPMYAVGIVPILVGAGAAYYSTGAFLSGIFWKLMAGAVLIIAWLNLSNDAYDAQTGVDENKEESVVNLTGGNRSGVLALANACLLAGAWLLHAGTKAAGDVHVGAALALAIGMGYMYQGPPFRLSYKGLGEPLCFLAFGPLATCAFFLAQAGAASAVGYASVTAAAAAASVIVGATTTSVLFCSHFHQIDGDTAAGKMSPLVRLGPSRGYQVLRAGVLLTYLLLDVAAALSWLPLTCLFAQILSVPSAMALVDFGKRTHEEPELVRPLKRYALKWHMALGASLAAGLTIAGLPATTFLL